MKFLKTGLSLALLGAGLAAVPASPSAAVGLQAAADPTGVQAMRQAADGDVTFSTESATGKVGFVAARGADADLYPSLAGNSTAKATAKTDAYLDEFGAAFGAGSDELVRTGVTPNRYGWTVSYVQKYDGVDVFGSRLKANVDKDGDLTAVTGFAVPDLKLSVDPGVQRRPGERQRRRLRQVPARLERRERRRLRLRLRRRGRRLAAGRLPHRRPARREQRREPARLRRRGQGRHRARHGRHRRQHPQDAQPVVHGQRRARPRALRDLPDERPRSGPRATPSPAGSTRTSRTSSTPPASPTGSTPTPSVVTPTTASAR